MYSEHTTACCMKQCKLYTKNDRYFQLVICLFKSTYKQITAFK